MPTKLAYYLSLSYNIKMRLDLSRTVGNLYPEVEAQTLEMAADIAMQEGLPFRVGYEDSTSLAPSGIYNPKLVKEIRDYRWKDPLYDIIPVMPRHNLREAVLAEPYNWSGRFIRQFFESIDRLEEWQEEARYSGGGIPQMENLYVCRGALTADNLDELLQIVEESKHFSLSENLFQPHELSFLQDCSSQLFDHAVVVILPNP